MEPDKIIFMEGKKTVLIFGISSFMGSNLAALLKDDFRVIGTYFENPVDIPGVLAIKCDVHDKDLAQKVVFLFKPDVTLYCVGLRDLSACQKHPKVADALNTAGVFNVSQASERYKSKFIYFSSCFIFSGEDTPFRENDTPMPSSVYGNTVASAEFYIQKSCLNYLIFRCAPVIGRSYNPMDLTWLEALEKSDFKGEKIICDTKVQHGYLDVWTLARLLKKAIELNVTNRLFQVSSKDIATRYEFAKLYLKRFDGNLSLLLKQDWKFPRTENRIALQNIGEELKFLMDVENVEEALSVELPCVKDVIENIYSNLGSEVKTSRQAAKNTGVNFI